MADPASSGRTQAFQFPWSGTDDEVPANLAVGSLRDSMLLWLKTDRGIHVETLLTSIGAVAGFAAQTAVFARVAERDVPLPAGADKGISAQALSTHLLDSGLFVSASTKSGETFYFGDLINGYLVPQVTGTYPLWGFVAAAAIAAGVKPDELPDCSPMFRRVSETIGSAQFGVLQVAQEHQPRIGMRQALDRFWPRTKFILTRTDGPGPANGRDVPLAYWPLVTALVARQFVLMSKDALDPRIGVAMLMESAIAMSKVDPKTVPQALSVE